MQFGTLWTSCVKRRLIQPAKIMVLEQRVVEKQKFIMADFLLTEAPWVLSQRTKASLPLTARLPARREWKG